MKGGDNMNKKEKQFKEASEMLDNICKSYNEANANNEDKKEISNLLFLAILAAESTGFKVEIAMSESGYIERLTVGY